MDFKQANMVCGPDPLKGWSIDLGPCFKHVRYLPPFPLLPEYPTKHIFLIYLEAIFIY